MTKHKQTLEAFEDEIFDIGISRETLAHRKVQLARTIEQAEKALSEAERIGNERIADKLREKIVDLQELFDRADEIPTDLSSDDEGSHGEDGGGDDDSKKDEKKPAEPEDKKTDLPSEEDGSEKKPDEPEKPEKPGSDPHPPVDPKDPHPTSPKDPEEPEEPDGPEEPPIGSDGLPMPPTGPEGDPPTPMPSEKSKEIDPFMKKELVDGPEEDPPEDQETVFEAAKRILSTLSGNARNGAIDGLEELLSRSDSIFDEFDESFKYKLTEAVKKSLSQMSDEEFGDEITSVMELVDQVIKVDYSDDLEARVKEIKKDASSRLSRMELEKEDAEHVKGHHSAMKAYEKENEKYKKTAGLRGLETFKSTLYRAINDQVEAMEDEVDSWAALDRRHEDDPNVVVKGKLLDDVYDDSIPSINVYFDQSGSWSSSEIEIGRRAISVINKFHEDGEINLKIFYISAAGVCTDASVARRSGGAEGWADTLKHIRESKVKNVIILSDRDLDYFAWSNRPTGDNGRTYVDGCVWWLWKNGNVSEKALNELIGRRGNFQYYFET